MLPWLQPTDYLWSPTGCLPLIWLLAVDDAPTLRESCQLLGRDMRSAALDGGCASASMESSREQSPIPGGFHESLTIRTRGRLGRVCVRSGRAHDGDGRAGRLRPDRHRV